MADRRDVHDLRICRADPNSSDLTAVGEADVRPGGARVGGFVHPVAGREISAETRFAHSHIDDIRIRLGDRYRAHGSRAEEAVGYVVPRHAGVLGFPDAAAGRTHVVDERPRGDTCNRGDASATVRADAAPMERFRESRLLLTLNRLDAGDAGARNHEEAMRCHKLCALAAFCVQGFTRFYGAPRVRAAPRAGPFQSPCAGALARTPPRVGTCTARARASHVPGA